MIPSSSEDIYSSPIIKMPYDVLREIFIRCLPRYPLKDRQPNATIAPMLLCHICSSWREVALTSATLWSHLSCCFTICIENSKTDLVKKELDFVRWWRKNHGRMAPFVRLTVQYKLRRKINQELAEGEMLFLLEYLTSAQYLDLAPFYWTRLQDRIKAGNEVVFRSLRTVEKSGLPSVDHYHHFQNSLPLHSLTALQRLSITDDVAWSIKSLGQAPIHWSRLTHLSLHHAAITLSFWFSLIRGVPNLQWAYINIDELSNFKEYTEPPEFTLAYLSTLCVIFYDRNEDGTPLPFSILFSGLHLPAVCTLSLSWFSLQMWYDEEIMIELRTVLKSTPAVATLALSNDFSLLVNPLSSIPEFTAVEEADPVWKYAQHLVDLQLELPYAYMDVKNTAKAQEMLDTFVRDTLCTEGGWFGLRDPACHIQTVTIVDHPPPLWDDWDEDEVSLGDFAMSSIQRHMKKSPNLVFRLTSDSVRLIAGGVSEGWASNI